MYPFTILLKDRCSFNCEVQGYRIKIDPGSRFTGLVVLNKQGKVIWAAEIEHRGNRIKKDLLSRKAIRRGRRNRHTRYRKARWANRANARQEGRLMPSLLHRVYNVETWTRRLIKLCPITDITIESVKFDTQLMTDPGIQGKEYQQGTLAGYEIKEYLLEKYGRRCVYCGKENIPLETEHLVPISKGGTDKISNLAIACHECNQRKGKEAAEEFIKDDSIAKRHLDGKNIGHFIVKDFLRSVAAVNSIRYELGNRLKKNNLPIEFGSGALTKYNRTRPGLPKAHWLDAACAGLSTPENLDVSAIIRPLKIKSAGHGNRQMIPVDKYGFPRPYSPKISTVEGFRTGDYCRIVKINKIKRIVIRSKGQFYTIAGDKKIGFNAKNCKIVQRADGYSYKI